MPGIKRAIDIVISAAAVVLLFPVFLIVAIAVVAESGQPVFFSQTRIGKEFQPFRILKFRSMRVGQPGAAITIGNDSRITRLGAVLRRTKLDELPQLLNVLRGDMSLVGPRPELPAYVEMYRERYRCVLQIRPGITDMASIRYRHEEALLASDANPMKTYGEQILPAKLDLAEEYVRRQSVWLDFSILLWTAQTLFARSK